VLLITIVLAKAVGDINEYCGSETVEDISKASENELLSTGTACDALDENMPEVDGNNVLPGGDVGEESALLSRFELESIPGKNEAEVLALDIVIGPLIIDEDCQKILASVGKDGMLVVNSTPNDDDVDVKLLELAIGDGTSSVDL
jgi:hypothetical protein